MYNYVVWLYIRTIFLYIILETSRQLWCYFSGYFNNAVQEEHERIKNTDAGQAKPEGQGQSADPGGETGPDKARQKPDESRPTYYSKANRKPG